MRARTKLVARRFGQRDARLVVVATEGARTEPAYFDALKLNGVIDRNRVVLEVIPTGADNKSSPESVLARLKEAAERYELKDFDGKWIVLDVDRWGERKLSEVAQEATQMGANLAVSNPSFEVWLLLHVSESCPARQRDIETELRKALPGWSKSVLDASCFSKERVAEAVVRARASANSKDRWPLTAPGTHMHRLMESVAPGL